MSKKGFRPLQDRVLVERIEEERKTAAGIVIPDNATEKSDQGVVVAIGPGKSTDKGVTPVSVQVGDRVLFGKYSGQAVKFDGKEYLVLREDELMCVVEGSE